MANPVPTFGGGPGAVGVSATPVLTAAAAAAINSKTAAPAAGRAWYFGGLCVAYSADPTAASAVQVYVRTADDSGDDFLLFETTVTAGGPAPVYLPRAMKAPADRKLRFAAPADAAATIRLVPDVWEGQA